jgi:ATP adenylyltransferase
MGFPREIALREGPMDQLWAPWRFSYVSAAKAPAGADPCFLCRGLAEADDRRNLIVCRSERSVVVLNRFPYNNGHLLIAPRVHQGRLEELDAADLLGTMQTMQRMLGALGGLMRPDGYNIGLNLGRAAGAGLPGHLHWHVVPRWDGDTNFMPVIADSKVIVQSLETLYDLLVARLRASEESGPGVGLGGSASPFPPPPTPA